MAGVFFTFLLNTAEKKVWSDKERTMIEQDNSFVFQAQTKKNMDRFIYKYICSNQNLKFKYTWALGKFVYWFNLCGLGSSVTEIFANRQNTSSLILSSDLSVCLGFS